MRKTVAYFIKPKTRKDIRRLGTIKQQLRYFKLPEKSFWSIVVLSNDYLLNNWRNNILIKLLNKFKSDKAKRQTMKFFLSTIKSKDLIEAVQHTFKDNFYKNLISRELESLIKEQAEYRTLEDDSAKRELIAKTLGFLFEDIVNIEQLFDMIYNYTKVDIPKDTIDFLTALAFKIGLKSSKNMERIGSL